MNSPRMVMAPESWDPPGPAPPERLGYHSAHEERTMLRKGGNKEPLAYVQAATSSIDPADIEALLEYIQVPSFMPAGPGGANFQGGSPGGGYGGGGLSSAGGGGNYGSVNYGAQNRTGAPGSKARDYANMASNRSWGRANGPAGPAGGNQQQQQQQRAQQQRQRQRARTMYRRQLPVQRAAIHYMPMPKAPGWKGIQGPNVRSVPGPGPRETTPFERSVGQPQMRDYVGGRGWAGGAGPNFGGMRERGGASFGSGGSITSRFRDPRF